MYAVIIELDDNGTLLVTCPDLPEVTTFGEDEEDAMRRVADAIEERSPPGLLTGRIFPRHGRLSRQVSRAARDK